MTPDLYEPQYSAPKRIGDLAVQLPPRPPGPGPTRRDHVAGSPQSERAEIVGYFQAKINAGRVGTKWKPLTARAVAIKLSHLPLSDCYYLKSVCLDAERRGRSFSAVFFSELKVKN